LSYGQSHTETLPTVSTTIGPTYATMINDVITEMRATLDAKVTPAGMDINADLSLRSGATYSGLTDVHRLGLYSQSAALSAATYPSAAYVVNGDLYYNDSSGNQIAITSGGAVNASAAGAITGAGYGTPVEVNWDATLYHFYSAASTYSDVRVGGLQLSDGSSDYVELVATTMSAPYTLTFPASLPASTTSLLTVTTAGALAYTATPTVTSLTTTGTLAVGTTSTFTGKATFATEYAHPQRVQHVTVVDCIPAGGANLVTSGTPPNPHLQCDADGQVILIPIRLTEGDRLEKIRFVYEFSANAGTRTFEIVYYNTTVGAYTAAGGVYDVTRTDTSTTTAVELDFTDVTISSPEAAGTNVGLLYAAITMINLDEFYGARIFYSRQ
jgi:hypothetical protein